MEQQRQFTKLNFSETPDPRGQSAPDTPRAADVVGGYLTEAAADLLYEPLGGGGTGTVTSVALTVPTGLSVSGSPVTTSGTFAITTTLTGYVKGNGSGFTASAGIPATDLTGTLQAAQFPSLTGDVTTVSGTLASTIAANAVTYAKMQDASAASILLGRGAGGGAGDLQEITLGANLSMSGTTINAASGGTGGLATITIPTARLEWTETVAALGVTGSSRVILSLAPAADTDENDPIMLAVSSLSAAHGTDQITVSIAFAVPAQGAIKLNWSAM